jgi:hypothetical protein
MGSNELYPEVAGFVCSQCRGCEDFYEVERDIEQVCTDMVSAVALVDLHVIVHQNGEHIQV